MNKVWFARVVGLMLCGVLAGCAGTGTGSASGPSTDASTASLSP